MSYLRTLWAGISDLWHDGSQGRWIVLLFIAFAVLGSTIVVFDVFGLYHCGWAGWVNYGNRLGWAWAFGYCG